MLDTKNTKPNHQDFPPIIPIGATTSYTKRQTPKTPKVAPIPEASRIEASGIKQVVLSFSDFQEMLQMAATNGAEIALKKVESNKRHVLYEKFRLTHIETSTLLGVSTNTLMRNRDKWNLNHYEEGNKRYYTRKSIDIFISNRS